MKRKIFTLADYTDADGVDRYTAATYEAEDSPLFEKLVLS